MEGPVIICINCVHFKKETWTCKAFENGIPDEIAYMGNEHKKPLTWQTNDIVFKEIEDANI